MAGRRALLGIGTLHELEVLDPVSRKTRTIKLSQRWLAWDAGRKTFHICVPRARRAGQLPAGVRRAHQKFHQAGASSTLVADVPSPSGQLTQLGLLKSLVYRVPHEVASPEKNPYAWHHAFGDTGHQGGDAYPDSVMPALVQDAKGRLFIRRRRGNIFTVDTWLRG